LTVINLRSALMRIKDFPRLLADPPRVPEVHTMVGITLTPEQIRSAPPEVRRWLEQEISSSLGFGTHAHDEHVVEQPDILRLDQTSAARLFEELRGMLPVVNVMFELGREGGRLGPQALIGVPLADILRHTKLQTIQQVMTCLQIIDRAARRIVNAPNSPLCILDRRGYCVITPETQASLYRVWHDLVTQQDLTQQSSTTAAPPAQPLHMSGDIPAAAVHMGASI
jgi:hypothetical protein